MTSINETAELELSSIGACSWILAIGSVVHFLDPAGGAAQQTVSNLAVFLPGRGLVAEVADRERICIDASSGAAFPDVGVEGDVVAKGRLHAASVYVELEPGFMSPPRSRGA